MESGLVDRYYRYDIVSFITVTTQYSLRLICTFTSVMRGALGSKIKLTFMDEISSMIKVIKETDPEVAGLTSSIHRPDSID